MDNIQKINSFIDKYNNFLLFGHEDPDADSICSMIVFSDYLRHKNKKTVIYASLPFTRKELFSLEKYCTGYSDNPLVKEPETAAFLIDCSSPSRTGVFSYLAALYPYAVIDHHDTGKPGTEADIINSKAPSATALILEFLEKNNYTPDSYQSQLLLTGLCTDTGFFRHIAEYSPEPFLTAARLCKLGASPNNAYYTIYGSRSTGTRIFLGLVLSRIQTFSKGRILTTYEKESDLNLFKPEEREKDTMYQLLLGTDGVEITAYFSEEKESKTSVSLRTRGDIDVSILAAHFGGGGHKKASGYTVNMSIENAMNQFIEYAEKTLFTD